VELEPLSLELPACLEVTKGFLAPGTVLTVLRVFPKSPLFTNLQTESCAIILWG
jgi:hypothetical protein